MEIADFIKVKMMKYILKQAEKESSSEVAYGAVQEKKEIQSVPKDVDVQSPVKK